MRSLRILVADDHDVVRQGVRGLLAARREWEICGEAASGLEAIERAMSCDRTSSFWTSACRG